MKVCKYCTGIGYHHEWCTRPQEPNRRDECPECKVHSDHTWWCSLAPAVLPDGTRPYYWRD